jgi:hypothetical protein
MSEVVQASRWPLSLLAGNRAKTPGALGYAASEVSLAARAPSLASAEPKAKHTQLSGSLAPPSVEGGMNPDAVYWAVDVTSVPVARVRAAAARL